MIFIFQKLNNSGREEEKKNKSWTLFFLPFFVRNVFAVSSMCIQGGYWVGTHSECSEWAREEKKIETRNKPLDISIHQATNMEWKLFVPSLSECVDDVSFKTQILLYRALNPIWKYFVNDLQPFFHSFLSLSLSCSFVISSLVKGSSIAIIRCGYILLLFMTYEMRQSNHQISISFCFNSYPHCVCVCIVFHLKIMRFAFPVFHLQKKRKKSTIQRKSYAWAHNIFSE